MTENNANKLHHLNGFVILAYQNNPSWLNESSPEEFKELWNKLQRIAHHSSGEQSKCEQLLKECDIFLNRLLCPISEKE